MTSGGSDSNVDGRSPARIKRVLQQWPALTQYLRLQTYRFVTCLALMAITRCTA